MENYLFFFNINSKHINPPKHGVVDLRSALSLAPTLTVRIQLRGINEKCLHGPNLSLSKVSALLQLVMNALGNHLGSASI